MAMARREIAPEKIDEQRAVCARLRERLGADERFAMVDTYGCQQNESDSEILRGYLREMGYAITDDEQRAEVIVVNTCAVREHA
ncbi:MAG: tRNA (N6-isopentenyl adenosine(37)-C2)-methylthiotransferase MiaB, partial [Oscillospiraceae bacterium]|nr:tRNA (N6-isopentenyl adenosine(37)-C2)-methylthiotransferase MiaB [Oscillospiraceae bacterium]